MKKFNVQLEAEIEIEFDENSEEFKALWGSYKEFIDPYANYESFCENIASQVARYGTKDQIEGVGYLKINGKNQWIFSKGGYQEVTGLVNVNLETDLNNKLEFEVSAGDISEDEKEENT